MSEQSFRIIALGISACTLGGLIYSLLQVRKSLNMATVGRLYGELRQVHETFRQYPLYRPYFFGGELPSEASSKLNPGENPLEVEHRCRAIAEMYLDIFEQILILRPAAPKELRAVLTTYVAMMCKSSPFLVEYFRENEEVLYPPEFRDTVFQQWKENQRGETVSASD